MATPNDISRTAGKDAVFIFKQEANDELDLRITIRKGNVLYQTMTKQGEILSDISSLRPYAMGNLNDGTTRNCLHALLRSYFFEKGVNPIERVKPEYVVFHRHSAIIGKREGVIYPKKWGFEERKKLRACLTEVGLEWLAKMIH